MGGLVYRTSRSATGGLRPPGSDNQDTEGKHGPEVVTVPATAVHP